jgi:5'-nucleotidase
MQLSGFEVQELFDFVARRSSSRGCVSQVQIAGARLVIDCTKMGDPIESQGRPGVATNIYIGTFEQGMCNTDADCAANNNPLKIDQHCDTKLHRCGCLSDQQCPNKTPSQCDVEAGVCWQPIETVASYELATSNYLAGGGSGFRVLQRNTTQNDTKVQQRDSLVDYIRAGAPCGADDKTGKLTACSLDNDCTNVGDGFVCACPEAVIEGPQCQSDATRNCGGKGSCVLSQCRIDLADFQRKTCEAAPNDSIKQQCLTQVNPCSAAGEQCKFLACVDKKLGNVSDGRIRMVGQ